MAEVVRQGIEKAEADLEKENQEKLMQAVSVKRRLNSLEMNDCFVIIIIIIINHGR